MEDGSLLDLVLPAGTDGLMLVRRTGSQFSGPSREITVGTKQYRPAEWDQSWLRAVRFPRMVGVARRTSEIFEEVCAFLRNGVSFDPGAVELVAAFALCTWFTDILEFAPSLWLRAPDALDRLDVLQRLAYSCRRAVRLSECRPATLPNIPCELKPTILIEADPASSVLPVLALTGRRGFYLPRSGRALDYSFTLGIVSGDWPRTDMPLLKLDLPFGSTRQRSPDGLEKAGEELQANLLRYRLDHYRQVRKPSSDSVPFTGSVQLLATSLTKCIDDGALRAALLAELQRHDQEIRPELTADSDAIAVEALLAACHESRDEITVGELTKLGNLILVDRGESPRFTYRGFGAMLRKLGINQLRRTNVGFSLTIDTTVRLSVHRLAKKYCVSSLPQSGCVECAACEPAEVPDFSEHRERGEH